jgi:hypothetical protein
MGAVMTNKYKAIGRIVYEVKPSRAEVVYEKTATQSEAISLATKLNSEMISTAVAMSDSKMHQLQGRMGLCDEEDDF